jgi:hypothetical protein
MTAAAAAGRGVHGWVTDSSGTGTRLAALAVVVAGGLVEGTALGVLQAATLQRSVPALSRGRWTLTTILVAGLGWAAASAPPALSTDSDGGPQPPIAVMAAGVLALGAVMGALLGAVQATQLRGRVRHPWRWISINAWAWAPTMAVIFVGASAPGSGWPDGIAILIGTVTGAAAGTILGLVTGWLMPVLDAGPVRDRVVVTLARTWLLRRQVIVLTVRGAVTGRPFELPVQFAEDAIGLVVVPGHPARKQWWRNLRMPAPVTVRRGRDESIALGMVLNDGSPGYDQARQTYRDRWRVTVPYGDPIVRLISQ